MQAPLKILLLEDLEEEAQLIERALKRENISFKALRVDTKELFIDALRTFNPDVILSDHALPQMNSIEALELCKENRMAIPFILVTGTVSEEFAVTCIKQGVDDYILKSNLSRLPSAIASSLRKRQMEREKREAELRLRTSNEELKLMNEELLKINIDLDNFVYSVSHNLRAPLMSVLGLINLVKKEATDSSQVQYSRMMEQSVLALDRTLKQILDYSRNARTQLNLQRVNLHDIIFNSLNNLKYIENFNNTEKNVTVDDSTVLYSDLYRLTVIFYNVLSNALTYQDSRKSLHFVNIHARVAKEEAFIKVQDNGIGIHEEYLPKIFNMFFRGTEKAVGSGLGLFLARECVQRINGTIVVNSKKGEGTTVEIIVPNLSPFQVNP